MACTESILSAAHGRPLFELGRVVSTPGALNLLGGQNLTPYAYLARHASGDWGAVCAEDAEMNNLALRQGGRILSSYQVKTTRLWIITEADRSATTLLLPEEY